MILIINSLQSKIMADRTGLEYVRAPFYVCSVWITSLILLIFANSSDTQNRTETHSTDTNTDKYHHFVSG